MKRILTVILLIFVLSQGFSQGSQADKEMIKLGWTLTSPLILNKINDKLTKEIVVSTIPKIIDQDVEAAVLEVANSIYKVKNIKVLNKEYLNLIKKNITIAISSIQKKDYVTSVNELLKGALMTDNYIRNGILDKADSKSQTTTNITNTSLIEKETINSKLFIGKNNDYMFFIPKGTLSEIKNEISTNTDNQVDDRFKIKLDIGNELNLIVEKSQLTDSKHVTIQTILSNNEISKKIKESLNLYLNKRLGTGNIIYSGIADIQNFKGLKYTYKYIDKETTTSSMANIYLSIFHSATFTIFFCTTTNDFPLLKKSIEEILENFYIIGYDELENSSNSDKIIPNENKTESIQEKTPECELNNTGILAVYNNSINPYDIYIDGIFTYRVQGSGITKLIVKEGNGRRLYAKQVSGYVLYPTEKGKYLDVVRCIEHIWQIP